MTESSPQNVPPPKLILIGTSAGGGDALRRLLAELPASINAAIVVVRHLPPDSGLFQNEMIKRHLQLECKAAEDGMTLQRGCVYFAPADHHLLVRGDKLVLTRGPKENRWRPSIDALFRSGAVAARGRAIGVLLTGYLSDGSDGLRSIKLCGGATVVQDPKDAAYPDMPQNALIHVSPEHCVALAEMGQLLHRLVAEPPRPDGQIPPEVEVEVEVALRVAGGISDVEQWGRRSTISCPDCGGALWQNDDETPDRFRCHAGHAYTGMGLLTAQSAEIEKTLWTAMRMFEERKVLLTTMAAKDRRVVPSVKDSIAELDGHARQIREILHVGAAISNPVDSEADV